MNILKKLFKMTLFLPVMLMFGVPAGGSGAEGGSGGSGEGGSGGEGGDKGNGAEGKDGKDGGSGTPPDKTFSQADVDKIVADRLAREKKKTDKIMEDMKKAMSGEQTPPAGGEGTGHEGGADSEALRKATDALMAANKRVVASSAQTEAIKLGVDPKFVADVVQLANLVDVEVKEDGSVDTAKISKAIEDVLKRVPVFKTSADGASGFKVGGEGQRGNNNNNGWNNNQQGNNNNNTGAKKRWNKQNF